MWFFSGKWIEMKKMILGHLYNKLVNQHSKKEHSILFPAGDLHIDLIRIPRFALTQFDTGLGHMPLFYYCEKGLCTWEIYTT